MHTYALSISIVFGVCNPETKYLNECTYAPLWCKKVDMIKDTSTLMEF